MHMFLFNRKSGWVASSTFEPNEGKAMDVSSEHSSAATTDSKLAVVDFVVILAYFAAVIGVGIWVSELHHGLNGRLMTLYN